MEILIKHNNEKALRSYKNFSAPAKTNTTIPGSDLNEFKGFLYFGGHIGGLYWVIYQNTSIADLIALKDSNYNNRPIIDNENLVIANNQSYSVQVRFIQFSN